MLWGLPFTDKRREGVTNNALVSRMKSLINTNGMDAVLSHAEVLKDNTDAGDLSVSHLFQETKHLASIALSNTKANKTFTSIFNEDGSELLKPLHLYLPAKTHIGFKVGWMKRGKVEGEKDSIIHQEKSRTITSRPPSLVKVYPMEASFAKWFNGSINESGLNADGENEEDEEEIFSDTESAEENEVRPLEEDPLWLRRNDFSRTKKRNDKYLDAYRQNITAAGGHYADGRRSHKWL